MTAQYVVVTGSVGAGATTVAKVIVRRWNAAPLLEGQIEENNPFFKDAQSDPHRWSFASQAHFLAASAARHESLEGLMSESNAKFVVEDRTPFEHHGAYSLSAHESGYLSDRELGLLTDLARQIEKQYLTPSVLVYREMTEAQLVERVLGRGRVGESADEERLRTIYRAFETFASEWARSPMVRIGAEVDVLTPEGEAIVVEQLAPYLGSPTR